MDDEKSIVDCSTISISYQVTGLANVSLTIYRKVEDGPPFTAGGPGFNIVAGNVRFKGYVTSQKFVPATDVRYNTWVVTAVCIGCRETGNLQGCN
jgi:hypothetical protein